MNRRRHPPHALTFACALLLSLCAASDARAQSTRADANTAPFNANVYRAGERLSYNVSFSNFMTAAHVETVVGRRGQFAGREAIELRAHAETLGVVSAALYSANNDYVSYIDPATGQPFRTVQLVRTGAGGSGLLPARQDLPAGEEALATGQVFNSFPGTYDFLAAVFRMRALPLAPGASYRMTVHVDGLPYDIELRVTGRETVKTNVGSSSTIACQIRVRNNDAADDYRPRIYFTDDAHHVPVVFTARHPAGEIRAELASVEFLTDATVTGVPDGATPPVATPGATPRPPAGTVIQPGGVTTGPPASGATTPGVSVTPGAPPDSDIPSDLPFRPGEQLNFNFYAGQGSQPIGTASFQVRARARYFNRDGLLLAATMQTTGAGQALFPVSDQINSYVDARSLLPFRTELLLQEGRRRTSWIVSVDQDRGNALFDDGSRVEMPAGTHDLISVFYALRSFDLSPGKENRVSLIINKRPRLLTVNSLRRETIQLSGRPIAAVVLSLMTSDANGDRFQLRLWVSTDRRRLPLRLTAQTPLGPVRADLAIIPLDVR
ncbi:MAG TPA: DUF3108 domain-containing protein [Pyrinomonadaceae bacterium]|nr:DUF3108 domain-containing protein [Pyrinomonadaceae bacterium]